MSLSPLVSFKSRFVTYLLNFPRILVEAMENRKSIQPMYLLTQVGYITEELCCMQKRTAPLRPSNNKQVVFRQSRFLKVWRKTVTQ